MTDLTALRIRVAELLGWTEVTAEQANGTTHFSGYYQDPHFSWRRVQPWQLPDYPRDLNACHEFEELLDADQCAEYARVLKRDHPTYCILDREQGDPNEVNYQTFSLIHATAEQRCRAFVATMTQKQFDNQQNRE